MMMTPKFTTIDSSFFTLQNTIYQRHFSRHDVLQRRVGQSVGLELSLAAD